MKKQLLGILLALSLSSAHAATFSWEPWAEDYVPVMNDIDGLFSNMLSQCDGFFGFDEDCLTDAIVLDFRGWQNAAAGYWLAFYIDCMSYPSFQQIAPMFYATYQHIEDTLSHMDDLWFNWMLANQ